MKKIADRLFHGMSFEEIRAAADESLFFTGLSGSLNSFIIKYLHDNISRKIVYCSVNQESLLNLKGDIETISKEAYIYLSKYDEEHENEISPLSSVLKKLTAAENYILLFDPPALNSQVITEENFKSKIIRVTTDTENDFDELISKLTTLNFNRKNIVEEENDFAVRGGILDIFPDNLGQPVRIEFFGNKIESIREFDPVTQRSITQIDSVEILPSLENLQIEKESNLADMIGKDVFVVVDEPDAMMGEHSPILEELVSHAHCYFSVFSQSRCEFIKGRDTNLKEINFQSKSQPAFNSNVKLLLQNLRELKRQAYGIFLAATDDYQTTRLKEMIEDLDNNNEFEGIVYLDETLQNGFTIPDSKTAVYTEHEIFGRYYRAAKKRHFPRWKGGISFRELNKVKNGDFMVHQNYGIGKYAGLRKINPGGIEQEAVKLLYQDNDVLFVNLNSLGQLKKYSAQEGHQPKLAKLGGIEWERLKRKTRKRIQEIAKDLIELYAKRKHSKGFRFSQDAVWQKELEAGFMYDDTPDQISATEAVKKDMQSEYPMDRLICGDVGFGKTEVAIRAAFKSVLDNKQAAVLVPTTILAEQHYNTFKDRVASWAVEVEHFSRFKTKAEQKEILKKLKEGKINIIIGTHRLLSKDVEFKDLGLLIVDEEQRFGVKAKEKIKMMKENVDVLTLTATPIPRTLNFSLLGARDMSIINTPPKNRQPIHTEIINFDRKLIANAIIRELQRGGQVYFVNDKISQLEQLARTVEELVPFARVAIAHGQMHAIQLEKVMMRFLEKKYNVLMCTKIIESGLDIPSVNTIIINRADNFGLAELYQLRGRVGRSNIKAYAYLIAPPHSSLTHQAIRRLHALEEFSELGSGMTLALRDLEIRGAGNLLGREQTGFISELGFETFMQILDEAVEELKTSSLTPPLTSPLKERERQRETEAVVESDVSVLIPEDYIEDENTRLELYQRLSKANTSIELQSVREEILDRFGKPPEQVDALFKQVELKLLASASGFERVNIYKGESQYYISLRDEEFFKSGQFEKIIKFLSTKDPNVKVVQTKKELMVKYQLRNSDHSVKKLEEVTELIREMPSN